MTFLQLRVNICFIFQAQAVVSAIVDDRICLYLPRELCSGVAACDQSTHVDVPMVMPILFTGQELIFEVLRAA